MMGVGLKPFWCYYGGKWRAAPRYPAPRCDTIIEPFAGAAGYSLRHPDRQVILADLDETICGLWEYLIAAKASEIRALPLVHNDQTVEDLHVCQEAKWLIGFWLNKGSAAPRKRPSKWMRDRIRPNSFWGEAIRERIASQVGSIKHWSVVHGSYQDLGDVEATWFIDPPYQRAGAHYRHGSAGIDYRSLATWCRSRRGQVVVCENEGADWLPFSPHLTIKGNESSSGGKTSAEVLWLCPSPAPHPPG